MSEIPTKPVKVRNLENGNYVQGENGKFYKVRRVIKMWRGAYEVECYRQNMGIMSGDSTVFVRVD